MKTKKITLVLSIFIIVLLFAQTVFAASWPADSTATELAGGLGTYEPSGIVWHSRLNVLFLVSDPTTSSSGRVTRMNTDGSEVTHWTIGGDLEGIAVADPTTNYVYVLNEYPYALYEVDISTGTKTKSWDLSSIGIPAPVDIRYGLEGMTYIPAEDYATSSGRGVFVVGSQETGTIYFLDIDTSTSGGSVSVLRSMTPGGAWLSDLFYDRETNVLYVQYGSTVKEMDIEGTVIATYTAPGSNQEGIALATSCPMTTTTIYIASDTPASVKGYANYPVTCPSSDDSGSTTAVWPASSSGTNIGSGLSSSFEPSGVAWNSDSNKLVVVNDNGGVSTLNADGSSVTSWSLSGDLEGVSASDSSTVYVLNEYPFAIYAFSTSSGTKTATWDLSSIGITTPSTTSNGLEGMAYIPDGDHSYGTTSFGGVFAVASSDDGRIYFVSVPVSSGTATLLGSIQPVAEAITDMFYSADTALLYVLYGTTLREMTLDGTVVTTYTSVPGTDPEGFSFVSDCTAGSAVVYIANDVGNTIMKYTGYPITCTVSTVVDTDADDDGLLDTEEATYGTNPNLADSDSDGLTDYQEVITYGTSGTTADSDNDSLTDYQEVLTYGTNALDTDSDDDGLTDYQEIVTYGTNALDTDSDDDSLTDYQEVVTYGTNALVSDSDSDGLTDYQEVVTYGTNALVADSDSDGLTDYQEVVTYGTNALVADSDGGSVSDAQEITNGTNPLDGTDDVVVIDPNLISSYTIDSANALVTVYYADGHSKRINPFVGTDTILVGLNYDNTVLIVTNGKRMKTYQNSVAKDNEYVSRYTPSAMTLTITHGSSNDAIALQYTVRSRTSTASFTLSGTDLVRN